MTHENGSTVISTPSAATGRKQPHKEEPPRCVYLLLRCLQPRFVLLEFLLASTVVFTVAFIVRMQHYAWKLPATASTSSSMSSLSSSYLFNTAQSQLAVIRWRGTLGTNDMMNSSWSLADVKRSSPLAHASLTGHGKPETPAILRKKPTKPWLLIGLPTTPRMARKDRKTQVDYIGPTVKSFLAHLPEDPAHLLFNRVRLLVIDNSGLNVSHRYLDELRSHLGNSSKSFYVRIVDNPYPASYQGKDMGSRNRPGAQVRRQTLDMASTLAQSSQFLSTFPAQYFMLMEDDFIPCPHALTTLYNATKKANIVYERIRKIKRNETHGLSSTTIQHLSRFTKRLTAQTATQDHNEGWIALRVSFAMNGIVLPSSDVATLVGYMRKHVKRRPPDHLIVEWFAGETEESFRDTRGRTVFAYKHNLFHHEGLDSTVGHRWKSNGPKCYDVLDRKTLFPPEAFNADSCNHDDISPCLPSTEVKHVEWPQNVLLPIGIKNQTIARIRAANRPEKPKKPILLTDKTQSSVSQQTVKNPPVPGRNPSSTGPKDRNEARLRPAEQQTSLTDEPEGRTTKQTEKKPPIRNPTYRQKH